MNILPFQLPLRQQLPQVQGNVDYHRVRELLGRTEEIIGLAGVEAMVVRHCMEQAEERAREEAKQRGKPYTGLSARQERWVQKSSGQALRCGVARTLVEESFREFSWRLADSPLFQQFCLLEGLEPIRVPSKSRLERYQKMLPEQVIRDLVVYRLMQRFYTEAAGRTVQSAGVIAYASSGDLLRFNPHLHGIFLEGGFDREGRFVHVPSLDLDKLSQCFRSHVIAFFLERKLINERLARNMLDWTHSGFSVDLSVKIGATSSEAREALAQYIARAPVSLKKILFEEHESSVLYRSEYNPYFKTNQKLFSAIEFVVDLLQHLPDAGAHLIRRYGLYSSRSRGTWSRRPYLVRLAPEGWREQHGSQSEPHLGEPREEQPHLSVTAKEARSAWAQLIAKVYEGDPLRCTRCGSTMKVKAIITDPQQVRRILRHLIKTGAAPPDLDAASVA